MLFICWLTGLDMHQVKSMSELLALPGSYWLIIVAVLFGMLAPVFPIWRAWHGLASLNAGADPQEFNGRRVCTIALAVICQLAVLAVVYFE